MKNKLMQSSLVLTMIGLGLTIGSVALSQIVMGMIGNVLYGTAKYSETPTVFYVVVYSLAIGMAVLGYYLFVVWVERREVSELEKQGATKEIGLGLAIGAGIITIVVAILYWFGYYEIIGSTTLDVIIRPLFSSILAGVVGEIIFRGILFRFVEKSWGSKVALVLSALLFGFLHFSNPNATFFGGLAIAVGAGLLLGAAYMWTRRLWLVIGIHAAWNFTLGSIFGLPVSGNVSEGIIQANVSGPVLLTGGEFGPEASLITLIVGTLVGVYFIKKAYDNDEFMQSSRAT